MVHWPLFSLAPFVAIALLPRVASAAFAVTYPRADTKWQAGSCHNVTWEWPGSGEPVSNNASSSFIATSTSSNASSTGNATSTMFAGTTGTDAAAIDTTSSSVTPASLAATTSGTLAGRGDSSTGPTNTSTTCSGTDGEATISATVMAANGTSSAGPTSSANVTASVSASTSSCSAVPTDNEVFGERIRLYDSGTTTWLNLAQKFSLSTGRVEVQVPHVYPGKNYTLGVILNNGTEILSEPFQIVSGPV
ncbi:hypothetical protein C8Q77DRAFT_1154429 [Trametes polyzona]|nr:hypothetical protein C8Q77DRAFT_1154429 [Trametes polyzona]